MSESTYDDLAGVVDLFGALTREELETALDELAFKQGSETDTSALTGAISDAIDAYYLVSYETTEEGGDIAPDTDSELLTVGPLAFPTLPPRAEDLPHILDYPMREVPRDELAAQVESRLRKAAAKAVQSEDTDEIARLLDVTYDLEAWANTDVESIRERLDVALAEEGQA
ncbi:hypothetical protein E6P09_06635 [Haloferax mediterranei ATCC 33500]|uniref:Uncharacterized protein n=1 Tax=Haloferax mediterranei (strain ATCC 33500 / DSM 1411 / JCM 8866 / NBRC 14739 / NCIMB 2177 / R-4) TaxID=523841 RepID=I3R2I2_HALMT|nr:hypothetical protein [Haloferax mediterranei]AFK18442.1 hypothetical protein HFX_0719 [Haloferax mediterranei ATCC 33500]AHZ22170.1 hypothetical protein BM92_05640 [Haloferax mediterranei ATCC 33500]EMA02283.1 hypothetical protein C439_06870 [Haloferax mediterranei ATCC 33500]MDX5988534.1 hypothetical protein [Haloferax mediterranei ATCC 33500]QCQ74949.1 hypothetical protein E6P09_06635 [Haloferax mediterranei ATCC 33500]